jgi:hypothetical protein
VTPERDRMAEQERSHLQHHLDMTGTDEHHSSCSRSGTPSRGDNFVPQPVFQSHPGSHSCSGTPQDLGSQPVLPSPTAFVYAPKMQGVQPPVMDMPGKPVLCYHAKHNHSEAKKVKSDDAEGLEKELLVAEGAKVMLTHNLWTSKGLVNGAQGVVKKIWFDQGSNARSHLPAVIFVKFDGYSRPETPAWEGINPSWVPIVPAVARWETKAGKALTHTHNIL